MLVSEVLLVSMGVLCSEEVAVKLVAVELSSVELAPDEVGSNEVD